MVRPRLGADNLIALGILIGAAIWLLIVLWLALLWIM
jgi:hypothetical protein